MTEPAASNDPQPDEAGFWQKLSDLIDQRFDEGVERQLKARSKQTSRNGGKGGLPAAVARALGGPFNPVE